MAAARASSRVIEPEDQSRRAIRGIAVSLPRSLATLVSRFDGSVLDVARPGARVRIIVSGEGQWDLLIRGDQARLSPADSRATPDASLSADAATR